jgi:hypothetical protein
MPLFALVAAAGPGCLASPTWTAVNVQPETAAFYADEFARALRAEGVKIVTAKDMTTLLGIERQKELLGCSEGASECMAELASALGCERSLVGQLARIGDGFRGTVRVISTKNGAALAEAPFESSDEKRLVPALERAARTLALELNPPPPPDLKWVPFVAGGAALGLGSTIAFGVAGSNAQRIAQSDEPTAVKLANEGKALEATGWVLAGVGTAAIVTGVVLLALPRQPAVVPSVNVSPGGASIGVRGVFP